MQNNRLLRIAPIVFTVQMVAGVLFRGMIWVHENIFNVIIEHFVQFDRGYGSIPYRIIIGNCALDGTVSHAVRR